MITITDSKGSSYARDVSKAKKFVEKEGEVVEKENKNLLPNTITNLTGLAIHTVKYSGNYQTDVKPKKKKKKEEKKLIK